LRFQISVRKEVNAHFLSSARPSSCVAKLKFLSRPLKSLPEVGDWLHGTESIERDYQELKKELGLGHYERRSWRGFHHHATLCIVAYINACC
jgi:hypothetical protein